MVGAASKVLVTVEETVPAGTLAAAGRQTVLLRNQVTAIAVVAGRRLAGLVPALLRHRLCGARRCLRPAGRASGRRARRTERYGTRLRSAVPPPSARLRSASASQSPPRRPPGLDRRDHGAAHRRRARQRRLCQRRRGVAARQRRVPPGQGDARAGHGARHHELRPSRRGAEPADPVADRDAGRRDGGRPCRRRRHLFDLLPGWRGHP